MTEGTSTINDNDVEFYHQRPLPKLTIRVREETQSEIHEDIEEEETASLVFRAHSPLGQLIYSCFFFHVLQLLFCEGFSRKLILSH